MKKMSTLFRILYHKKGMPGVIYDEIRPENQWVFDEPEKVKITRKFDGQATAVINGELYRRYDAKKGKKAPPGAIPCDEPDPISGHHPHWVKVSDTDPNDRFLWAAWLEEKHNMVDGTYEFCGVKVGTNAEELQQINTFIKHGSETYTIENMSFETIREFLRKQPIEGLVFHHEDGRMCKIRKTDFGFVRQSNEFYQNGGVDV